MNTPLDKITEKVFDRFPFLERHAQTGDFKVLSRQQGTVTIRWSNTSLLCPNVKQINDIVGLISPGYPERNIILTVYGLTGIEVTIRV